MWLIRWGIIIGISLLSAVCFYVALVSGWFTLLQVIMGSLAVPLLIGVYIFFPITIADVFNRLWNDDAIGPYRGDSSLSMTYQEFVTKHFQYIYSPWLKIMGFLVVLATLYQGHFYVQSLGVHSFSQLWEHWILLVILSLYALIFYMASLSLVRLLLVAIALNRVFSSYTIKVVALHPDRSGGLGALHQLLWISDALFIGGLCLALSLHEQAFDSVFFIVLLFAYLILFPSMLMVWLVIPHREMVRERNAHLQTTVDEYYETLQETGVSIREPTASIVEGTERLAALQKRYDQVKEAFPTWPVQISFARNIGFTLLLPLLTSLVPAVLGLLTKIAK